MNGYDWSWMQNLTDDLGPDEPDKPTMQEKLTKVWRVCETRKLGKIFKAYMEGLGVNKWTSKATGTINTYLIDGKDTDWNRVSCYYNKDSDRYGNEDLKLVLRKRAGSYFIVERYGVRGFEADHHGIIHYDEKLLMEIMADHEPLFQKLFNLAA